MAKPLPPGSHIGIFGSGQLGRMLAMAAAELGFKTHIYSDTTGPACDVAAATTIAPYTDASAIRNFANSVDVITFEFENIPQQTVEAAAGRVAVFPSYSALAVAQDRLDEKKNISGLGIPVAPFANIEFDADIQQAASITGLPGTTSMA